MTQSLSQRQANKSRDFDWTNRVPINHFIFSIGQTLIQPKREITGARIEPETTKFMKLHLELFFSVEHKDTMLKTVREVSSAVNCFEMFSQISNLKFTIKMMSYWEEELKHIFQVREFVSLILTCPLRLKSVLKKYFLFYATFIQHYVYS